MSESIPVFCGVDAGGTSCRALVASACRKICGEGMGPTANPNHAGWSGARASVSEAIRLACENAHVEPDLIESIFIGMASVLSAEDRSRIGLSDLALPLHKDCRISMDHDVRIALQGGLCGRPGIALIAGTGSSCYGRNARRQSWQAGGWDQLLDDLGSGFDLAQKGMAAACQSADGRLSAPRLQERLFKALNVENLVEFAVKVHRPKMTRSEIAALAPLVLEIAEEGDKQALRIVSDGANELARMVEAVKKMLFHEEDPEVIFIGGLLEKSPFYREQVRKALSSRLPGSSFREAELRPVVGAWMLASLEAGANISPEQLKKISERSTL